MKISVMNVMLTIVPPVIPPTIASSAKIASQIPMEPVPVHLKPISSIKHVLPAIFLTVFSVRRQTYALLVVLLTILLEMFVFLVM